MRDRRTCRRRLDRTDCLALLLAAPTLIGVAAAPAGPPDAGHAPATPRTPDAEIAVQDRTSRLLPFDCGYRSPQHWLDEVRAAVARGEITDPATRVMPRIAVGPPRNEPAVTPCLSSAHIYTYEDTDSVFLSDFSTGQAIDILASATNELLATHGDIYDFIGFWLSYAPHHTIGAAVYIALTNDVTGIGVQSAVGSELYDRRPDFGVGGDNLEGWLVMWNINNPAWQPGSGPSAELVRIALNHEYAHRFAMYLPPLLDGRSMQGYGGLGCYTPGHPNPGVDNQGSALGIGEWVGSDPAVIQSSYPDFYDFNSDTGGLWSPIDLYLMGYVSPAEMDAMSSEFRYMDDWDCTATEYAGPISTIFSADIIAAAGPRLPDHASEDKHYRTGWIMIHLPGDPPNSAEFAKAIAIHEQQQMDWSFGTLGRGTMDHSLFDDCNCNDVPDDVDISTGAVMDCNCDGMPDACGVVPGCPGNTNLDCVIDADDFLVILNDWGACDTPCPPYCAGDTNAGRDCFVNTDDFLAVLAGWGACPACSNAASGRTD